MDFMDNQNAQLIFLCLAVFRIYLEVIGFNFNQLPLTKAVVGQNAKSFHRLGLVLSVGYIIVTAPGYLLG
jgi:hypothetical protein